ncbi:MAG TPA: acyl-CoA dehydrogenase family protein [Ottowia sp.]|nr:acyl-CoA dehydrogenase family protein [Ottowia sp.]
MDIDTQQMLVDSARHWAGQACTQAERRAVSAHAVGCPPERWRALGELGWLGMVLPEEDGGLDAGLPAVCLLTEQLGRALLVEPFVSSAVLGASLLAEAATGELRREWLPALATGERRVAWMAWEADGGHALSAPAAVATVDGAGFRLQGDKGLMPGAGEADGLLVTAHMPGDPERLGLFLVEAGTPGATVDSTLLYDGRHGARLTMAQAQGRLLQKGPAAAMAALLERALARGQIVHCAETLGTAQAAFEITLEYVRSRKQFGRALSNNQVIQHRLVDLYVEQQEARALCLATAAEGTAERAAALGARVSEVARNTWGEAIQLHGAIGMTEEYVLGEYVRRLALAADLYGSAASHLDRLAQLSLDASP